MGYLKIKFQMHGILKPKSSPFLGKNEGNVVRFQVEDQPKIYQNLNSTINPSFRWKLVKITGKNPTVRESMTGKGRRQRLRRHRKRHLRKALLGVLHFYEKAITQSGLQWMFQKDPRDKFYFPPLNMLVQAPKMVKKERRDAAKKATIGNMENKIRKWQALGHPPEACYPRAREKHPDAFDADGPMCNIEPRRSKLEKALRRGRKFEEKWAKEMYKAKEEAGKPSRGGSRLQEKGLKTKAQVRAEEVRLRQEAREE